MSWNNFPPTSGQAFSKYYWASQPYLATQERAWATGVVAWPPPTFVWGNGNVGSLVNNNNGTYTLTDSGASGMIVPTPCTGIGTVPRWFNYNATVCAPTIPKFYDLIIDRNDDVSKCLHLQIVGNTATTFTLTDTPIADAITSNFASASDWTGQSYYIIRRGGLWWSDRWIDYPNDQEAWNGLGLVAGAILPVTSLTSSGTTAIATVPLHGFSSSDSVTIAGALSGYNGVKTITVLNSNQFSYTVASGLTTPSTGTITAQNPNVGANDPAANYPSKLSSGYELVVQGSDGYLHRIAITGVTKTNLLFARQSFTVVGTTVPGQYVVTATGNKARLILQDNRPHAGFIPRWFDSTNFAGEAPIDPGAFYFTRSPKDATIGATRLPKSVVSLLGGAGCTTPVIEKILDVDLLTEFDDPCNPPDSNYTPNRYRGFRGLQDALESLCQNFINKNNTYSSAPAIPTFVPATWFAASAIGQTFSTTSSSLDGSGGLNFGAVGLLPYTPITLWYAVLDTDGTPLQWGEGTCDTTSHITDPTQLFTSGEVGKTVILSTGWTRIYEYCFMYMYDRKCFIPDIIGGHPVDPPTSTNPGSYTNRPKSTKYREVSNVGIINDAQGIYNFTNGDYGRYEGDNSNDPNIHPELLTTDTTGLNGYYEQFIESTLPPAQQLLLNESMIGTVTSATAFSITDTTKNWWTGVLHTETGTFNSGSTTTGGDSTKNGSGFWGNGSFGSNNYITNMVAQVTIGGTEYRRFITNYNGTLTLTWLDALPSSANGASYQIRFPKYTLNRWGERTLKMTYPDGSVHSVLLDGNDDNTLYFPTQAAPIPVGTTYQIIENLPGGVYKWNSSGSGNWDVPTGNDPRTSVAWLKNQRNNHPFTRKRFSRACKFDLTYVRFWDEIYLGLQQLMRVRKPFDWISNGDQNANRPSETTGDSNPWPDAQTVAQGNFTSGTAKSSENGQPFCVAYTDYNCACYSYGLARRYAYGKISNISMYQTPEVDFYAKAEIPIALDGTSSTTSVSSTICPTIITFDANGDSVSLGTFQKFDTQTGNTVTSAALGTLNTPNPIGPAPTACSGGFPVTGPCAEWAGYSVTEWWAIARFDVGSGFNYQ